MAPFDLMTLEGKGIGAVANKAIASGTLIVAEAYVLKFPRHRSLGAAELQSLENAVEQMSNKKKKRLRRLANAYPGLPQLEGIIKTNAMPLGRDAEEGGLFLTCSRFNHSCLANAAYSWQGEQEQQVVYAVKDIAPGDEITVCYLSNEAWPLGREPRKVHLLQRFRFDCDCKLCNASEDQVSASDIRRSRIASLQETVGDGILILSNPSKALGCCKSALSLLEQEGASYPERESVLYDAFQICVANKDYARAKAFALLCKDAVISCQGPASTDGLRYGALADRPSSHRLAGSMTRWALDARHTMEADQPDFESWLWRRAS